MNSIVEAHDYPQILEETSISRAYRAAGNVIKQHSRTFHFATALLPARRREAIRSLYAFCRVSDDLVDQRAATQEDVERWRAQVRLDSAQQMDPVLLAWSRTRESYGIDTRYESELLDGISLDLRVDRYPDWPALERYCYLVASTVGLLSIPILGLAQGVKFNEAAPAAIQLGIALQMTNILRDIGEDAARGKVYLPESDLRRFGLTAGDILSGAHDDRFIDLIRFEIARTREIYRHAIPGIRTLSPGARMAVGAAAFLYRAILDEIEAIGYQVFRRRAHTSGLKKLSMLPEITYRVLTL